MHFDINVFIKIPFNSNISVFLDSSSVETQDSFNISI